MKTILFIKLLITLIIINYLKITENKILNNINIELIQKLIEDELKMLFPFSNINNLLYLVKLILLQTCNNLFKSYEKEIIYYPSNNRSSQATSHTVSGNTASGSNNKLRTNDKDCHLEKDLLNFVKKIPEILYSDSPLINPRECLELPSL